MAKTSAASDRRSGGIITGFLLGIVIALIFTAAVFLLCAVLLTFTNIGENIIPPLSIAVTAVSSFFAGFKTAGRAQKAGILWGVLSALFYIAIVMLLISTQSCESVLSGFRIGAAALSLICGAAGGVLGINTKK